LPYSPFRFEKVPKRDILPTRSSAIIFARAKSLPLPLGDWERTTIGRHTEKESAEYLAPKVGVV